MTRESFTMLLLGLILGVLITGLYLISSQIRIIQYTTLKMNLESQQIIVEALLPLTAPVVEEKKRGIK